MNSREHEQKKEPKIGKVLRDDFTQLNFKKDLSKEYKDLKKFYIDEEKKKRSEDMSKVKRWI